MNIAVIFGGESCEHDISIITGVQLINKINEYLYNIVPIYIDKNGRWFIGKNLKNIDNYPNNLGKLKQVSLVSNDNILYIKRGKKLKKYCKIDIAFVCMHGQRGEDGSIAGILEQCHIPYSASSMLASSIAMDKVVFKYILKGLNIECVESLDVSEDEFNADPEKVINHIVEMIDLPIIIKPSRQGSSIGIKVCKNKDDLYSYLKYSFMYDNRLLIEKFINIKKEVNIALFKDKDELIFSKTEEPVYHNEILDFDDKYLKNAGGFETIKRISPAKISIEAEGLIKEYSAKIYKILDMFGVVRFDFLIDQNGIVYVNEVNSIPGSMANYLFDKSLSYSKLIDRIVLNSLIRKEKEDKLIKKFDSSVLGQGFDGIKK